MRFAKCICKDCRRKDGEFLIVFKDDMIDYQISCPLCGSKRVKFTWIDRAGINKEINGD